MTSRERFQRALSHQEADRIPMTDRHYWPDTIARWESEGLPKGADPLDYFRLDRLHSFGLDSTLQLPPQVVEEDEDYRVAWNADGVLEKEAKRAYVPPSQLAWRIQTADDWLRVRDRLVPTPDRLQQGAREKAEEARARGQYIYFWPEEPTWVFLRTLGFERASIAMLEEPDFFDDVLEVATRFFLGMLDILADLQVPVDAVWFSSDICYRSGMLFSPRIYREHVLPRHRRIMDRCHEMGLRLIYHCDGYVGELIPLLIEAGVDCIQPLEARAGNDVRVYRRQYGHQIAFFGNINADLVAEGDRDAIEEEVRTKIGMAKQGGGYLYHIDHSVPPGVSFASYSWLIECVKRYGQYE